MHLFTYLFMLRKSFVKQPENQFLLVGLTEVSQSCEKVVQALEHCRGQHLELNCITDIILVPQVLTQPSEVQVRNKISDYPPMPVEHF